MQPTPEIASFWREFATQEAAFFQLPPAERVDQINALISAHVHGVMLEVLGAADAESLELVVTAQGSIEFFPLLSNVVAAAPALQYFKATAFRARSADPEFSIQMEGLELSTTEVLVTLEQDDGRIALELQFQCPIAVEFAEHARHMAFIMMDHVLGEFDFAVKVGAVDFVAPGSATASTPTPLNQLPAVFDAFWVQTLGRTGIFPSGEGHWESLELQINCAVDDAGNDVVLDDFGWDEDASDDGSDEQETGAVAVNISAGAVAMRADLACALTVDIPVPDADALAHAQALQEQAGTLLQQSHHGLMVLTVVKEARRQALYYVGDEAAARQALALLLARPEAEHAEVKATYDPAWTAYFEYAGYLA